MQCANCQRPAIYIYAPRQISPSPYCERHLPTFLKEQARAGLLETTPAFHESRASAFAKLATHTPDSEPVEEAPEQSDEPNVAENASGDEEKPKRRRRTRKVAEETEPLGEPEITD